MEEKLRDIKTRGKTQKYRDLKGAEIQSYRDSGWDRLRNIKIP